MEDNNNDQPLAPSEAAAPQTDAPAVSEPAALETATVEPQPEVSASGEASAETVDVPSAEPPEAFAEPMPQNEDEQSPAIVSDGSAVPQEVPPPEGEPIIEPEAAPSHPLSGEVSGVASDVAEGEQVIGDAQPAILPEGQSQAELPGPSEGDSHIVITIPADSAATELTEGTTMVSKEALPPPPPSAAPTNRGFDNWVQEIPTSGRSS